MIHKILSFTVILSSLFVVACSSSGSKAPTTTASAKQDSARPLLESESIDKAMKSALAQAEASGNTQEVIATLAQINSRNPNDAIIATRYARALREDDQINKAQRILQSFVNAEKPNVEALTEMAMTQLSLGDYDSAKTYAIKATVINPKNARGYLALGTAQDALKDHQNAEQSFRQGLKYWKGDPSPILNNLALNLASQGHLDQSLSLLERAIKISPRRMELERNRRIIATLIETSGSQVPPPYKKPEITIPEAAKPASVKPASGEPAVQAKAPKKVVPQKKKVVKKTEVKAKAPQQIVPEKKRVVKKTTVKTKATKKAVPQKKKVVKKAEVKTAVEPTVEEAKASITSATVKTNIKLKSNIDN